MKQSPFVVRVHGAGTNLRDLAAVSGVKHQRLRDYAAGKVKTLKPWEHDAIGQALAYFTMAATRQDAARDAIRLVVLTSKTQKAGA